MSMHVARTEGVSFTTEPRRNMLLRFHEVPARCSHLLRELLGPPNTVFDVNVIGTDV